MAHEHDDPPEFTGSTQTIKADATKGKRAAPAPAVVPPVAPVAIYAPPATGASHAKVARKAVAERLDLAEAALSAAQLEVSASYNELRAAERDEGAAHLAFIATMPAPSALEVSRGRLAAEQAAKQLRADQGLEPVPKPTPTHNRSPVDTAAANRPRPSPQQPTAPLRSNVVRR
jgi:hypothetical protein